MAKAILFGAIYFAIVFTAAFGLGVLRVTVVAPATGPLIAVLIEVPIIIGGSWILAKRLLRDRPLSGGECALAGGFAFGLLMATECALAVWLFGQTAFGWALTLFTPLGLIGLAGQVIFGLMPMLIRQSAAQFHTQKPW